RLRRHHARRGEEHPDYRREDDKQHHPVLGERIVGPGLLRQAARQQIGIHFTGIHLEGSGPRKAKKFSTTRAISSSAAPALWAAASPSGRLTSTFATPRQNCRITRSAMRAASGLETALAR